MKLFCYFLTLLLLFSFNLLSHAQEQDSIRISGVVISADSLQQIPNATIQRSDIFSEYRADSAGYFSIFAYPADTITFSSVGYNSAMFVVPQGLNSTNYSLVESMVPDSIASGDIQFYPMPPAEAFINAFVDKSLLYADKYEVMRRNIERIDEMEDEEAFLSKYRPLDINFGYGRLYNNAWGPVPGNNFLNPQRWSNFVKDLQRMNFESDDLE
jgi:hypothetical protein